MPQVRKILLEQWGTLHMYSYRKTVAYMKYHLAFVALEALGVIKKQQ